tara:strand:- start:2129 stop:2905 length:777 start_codon:yes stop_codon:yes gene_type:complete
MKNRVMFVSGVLLIFMLSLSLVAATEIKIQTKAYHKASISVLASGQTYSLIDSFHIQADADGIVSHNYVTSLEEFDLGVLIRFDGEKISYERMGPFPGADIVYIDLIDPSKSYEGSENAPAEEVEEEVVAEGEEEAVAEGEEEVVAEEVEEAVAEEGITGQAVAEGIDFNPKVIYYVLGLVLGLLVIGAGVAVYRKKRDPSLRGMHSGGNEHHQLRGAERKLAAARQEINRMKNEEKVKDIENQIQREKDEIRRLRKG